MCMCLLVRVRVRVRVCARARVRVCSNDEDYGKDAHGPQSALVRGQGR
jgi:hypothetical protein